MKMKITLHGVAYEVDVEVLDEGDGFYAGAAGASSLPQAPRIIPSVPAPTNVTSPVGVPPRLPEAGTTPSAAAGNQQVTAPVGGIIVEVKTRAGDHVKKGDELLILEAMKMHTSITAPIDGQIKSISVAAGDTVRENQVLVELV